MLRHLELTNVGPTRGLRVDFAERFNVLTGDNGAGKTFLLDTAWWVLTRSWPGSGRGPIYPYRAGSPPRLASDARIEASFDGTMKLAEIDATWRDRDWVGRQGHPAVPGLVLYLRADNGFCVWDPLRNRGGTRRAEVEELADLPPFFSFTQEQVFRGLVNEATGKPLCNGLMIDWPRWQDSRDSTEFDQLVAVLDALSTDSPAAGVSADALERLVPGDPVRLSVGDVTDYPTVRMPYGTVPVNHASEGVRRLLALAYLLVWAWREHEAAAALYADGVAPERRIILLVDELEMHLHPAWQRSILPSLVRAVATLAGEADLQVVLTTHSPLVLASLESEFDEDRDALLHFGIASGSVTVEDQTWYARGDSSNWLQSEVFGLRRDRSVEAERALVQADALMFQGTAAPVEAIRETHHALLRAVPDLDPIWARWVPWVEARAAESAGS